MTRTTDYAYIETTNYCNLACTFCNRDQVIGPLQHMPIFKFKQVLEKLGPDIKEAKLMGMGEPYLHPHFSTICRLFKEKYPDAFLISATNGQYKPTDNFSESLKYIDMLYISIDGYEDTYEEFRPPAKWGKLISFLEAVRDMDHHNCQIFINYTANPGNVHDIERVHALCAQYNLKDIRINIVQNWDETSDVESTVGSFTDEQIEYLKTWQYAIKGRKDWDYSDCFWVQRGAYITVEGNMKVCCMNTSAKTISNVFFVKNIKDHFESQAFQDIKSGCETNNPTDHCKSCSYKELTPVLQKLI